MARNLIGVAAISVLAGIATHGISIGWPPGLVMAVTTAAAFTIGRVVECGR